MMAAIQAARTGAAVTLLEHNEKPGKKILATGNGRCNLTNLVQEPSRYRSSQPDFPWKIITQYPLEDTLAFFSELGIYTKDRNGWVYPYSDQAAGVAQVLELEARHQKVKIKTTEEVTDILREDGQYLVKTATWQYLLRKLGIKRGRKQHNRVRTGRKTGTYGGKTASVSVRHPWKRQLLCQMGRKPDGRTHHVRDRWRNGRRRTG